MFNSSKDSSQPTHKNRTSGPGTGSQLTPSSKDAAAAGQAGAKVRERKFENGDRYRGGWLSGLPEGEGKYEWSDGSCYEGGWKAGQKHGVGKYTWNSGASYQGQWQNGFMHGVGTFEAPDGSKYQGGWREDLKHGLGRKIYANGDVYEGLWFNGKPEGPGRYIWVDFNEYDGEWRSGRLHGQGTFVWKTGERYDGEWKAGQEDGVGMFTFRDGSTYEGFWHKGKKHGVGIFRPATAPAMSRMHSLGLRFDGGAKGSCGRAATSQAQGASSGRSAFADATAAAAALPDEAAADYLQPKKPSRPVSEAGALDGQQQPHGQGAYGSAKSMSSMGGPDRGAASQTHTPRGRRDQVMLKEYNDGRLVRQQVLSPSDIAVISSALASPPEANSTTAARGSSDGGSRQQVTPLGEVLYKDHSAFDLMVQLQLGIRWSVTSAALDYTSPAALQSGLQPPDYATTITQEFPRAGSRSTPVHPAADFVWKDYAPAAFRMLRELAGVEQHEFINQLCGDQALRLLAPQGRSGAMFFLSSDRRFLVRTITCAEKKLLLSLLQRYAEHIHKYPNSLLTRFYGLHRVSAPKGGVGQKVRFVVMGNIFCTDLAIQQRYDLKGSSKGRTAGAAAAKAAGTGTVLKDLDLQQRFRLEPGYTKGLYEQLDADTRLLSAAGMMGYSMLLGVHERHQQADLSTAISTDPHAEPLQQQQQHNVAEHSNAAGLAAAVARLEVQLNKLKLDKWAHSALLQLGRTNLLVGLAGSSRSGASSSSGSSNRRATVTRTPTLVLATRPKRSRRSRPQPSAAGAAVGAAAGVAAEAQPAAALETLSLQDRLGVGMAGVALPLQAPGGSKASVAEAVGSGKQQQQPPPLGAEKEVLLYFGIVDFLQAFTMKKRLESCMRRMVSSAHAISAVSPGFYALRFRAALKKVFV